MIFFFMLLIQVFSSLSGYKISWTKSSLMHLNSIRSATPLPSNIPVVRQFRYLGTDISPSLFHKESHNFQSIHNQMEKDLERSKTVKTSKLSSSPHINSQNGHSAPCKFLLFNDPPSPPKGYWEKLHSLTSKFIWNGKRPRLKLKTLQQDKIQGGLGLPNFKMYSWSFG